MATVLYFGIARELAGVTEERLEIEGTLSEEDVWRKLVEHHPTLTRCKDTSRLAVDMEYVSGSATIEQGSEIAVIPPVAGG